MTHPRDLRSDRRVARSTERRGRLPREPAGRRRTSYTDSRRHTGLEQPQRSRSWSVGSATSSSREIDERGRQPLLPASRAERAARQRRRAPDVRVSDSSPPALRPPGSSRKQDLEDHAISDRPLDQAVTAFSPGSEVTREGSIHTCVGFAAYDIKGPARPSTVDPLGDADRADPLPRVRQHSTSPTRTAATACVACGGQLDAVPSASAARLPYPLPNRDYDDTSEGMGIVGVPPTGHEARRGPSRVVGGMTVERWPEPVRVIRINDNNGRCSRSCG